MITDWIRERRWFRAKARGLVSATTDEVFTLDLDGETVSVQIVRCAYGDGGEEDRYVLFTATARGEEAERIARDKPHLVVGAAPPLAGAGGVQYDALGNERLLAGLLRLFEGGGVRREAVRLGEKDRAAAGVGVGVGGADANDVLVVRPFAGFAAKRGARVAPRPTTMEQTNTSVVFGDSFILKIVRKLDDGRSAELDMGEFLTEHGYASAPAVVGAIEIERAGARTAKGAGTAGGAEPATVGILHRFSPNEGDAWSAALKHLAASPAPESYLARAELLGRRVGEMHDALARGTDPAFSPVRIARAAREALAAAVVGQAEALARPRAGSSGAAGASLTGDDVRRVAARARAFVDVAEDPVAMRIHGDLHLGQILATKDDFVIIDFEGEPARSLAERKAKRSPLADVAGMLRSFDYAAATALGKADPARARAWSRAIGGAFVAAYRAATRGAATLDAQGDGFAKCLDFYVLEKCLYEIAYEANNRPDWIAIPLGGLRELLDKP